MLIFKCLAADRFCLQNPVAGRSGFCGRRYFFRTSQGVVNFTRLT